MGKDRQAPRKLSDGRLMLSDCDIRMASSKQIPEAFTAVEQLPGVAQDSVPLSNQLDSDGSGSRVPIPGQPLHEQKVSAGLVCMIACGSGMIPYAVMIRYSLVGVASSRIC